MIALIAHDRQKDALIDFVRERRLFFESQEIVATGSTGRRLMADLGLEIECVAHGPEGGDLIIGGEWRRARYTPYSSFAIH